MGEVTQDYTVITNGIPRDVIEREDGSFVRYKGEEYDLQDFQRIPEHVKMGPWDGYISEGFFMGILLQFVPGSDFEQVVMGRYYS